MDIVIIGSGNVATHMTTALKASGNRVVQVYSRTFNNAELLAQRVEAEPIDNIGKIYPTADLYILSVKDDVLSGTVAQMPLTTGVWAHTGGSVPISILSQHKKIGAIYPLQTFSREREVNFRDIPLFIEGNSSETTTFLKNVAETISGNVHLLSGDKRRILHLAAVFACNFANHMYTLASEIMGEEDLPFHLLNSLISETAAKVMVVDPRSAQTGPAVRFDEEVMQKHLDLLDDPMKKEIYSMLSRSIHKTHR